MSHRHSHDKATTHSFGRYSSDKRKFNGHRVVLTIRNPRDVVVSHWHILHYRAQREPALNMNLFQWTQHEHGLPFVVRFLNDWGEAISKNHVDGVTVIRYEDLKKNPIVTVRQLALGFDVDEEELTDELLQMVVRRSSFDKVRDRFSHSNTGEDVRAYSARRGEANVWHQYYTRRERRWIDLYVGDNLKYFREFYV